MSQYVSNVCLLSRHLQESELPEDNAPQKPLPVIRAELNHHRRLAHNGRKETGTHV